MRSARLALWSVLLFCISSTASAQVTDPDLRLLADQNGAAPNVMILFDTSGSMQHAVWHPDFDPKKFHDAGSPCSATVYAKSGSGRCPGSGRSGDVCPENDISDYILGSPVAGLSAGSTVTCKGSAFVAGCGDIPAEFNCKTTFFGDIKITLPDLDRANDVDPSDSSIIDEPDESTYWAPNYVHWFMTQLANTGKFPMPASSETRKIAAKRVIKDLINELNPTLPDGTIDQKIRFGIAGLHTDALGVANGGYVIVPIADGNTATLISTLRSSRVRADTSTPLSEALVDVGRYFVGSLANPSGGTGLGAYSVYKRNTTDGGSSGSSPKSPLDPSVLCRKNYVVVLTDGEPYNDANDHHGSAFSNTFGADFDGDGNSNNASDLNDTLDDVAAYLYQKDLVADSVMPGVQNIVTYTIGFSLDSTLLRDAAKNGDGQYFSSRTATDLADQLRYSLEDIVLRGGSFTAAAVPTSQSGSGSGFFTAYFTPRPRGFLYEGHLQAYRIDENSNILGNDGQSAIDPTTGAFYEPRTTYFWDASDMLADPNNPRNLFYTRAGARDVFTTTTLGALDLGLVDADLPNYPAPPGLPFANAEGLADAIVSYARGADSFDEDVDGDLTELRPHVLGDIFHSNPLVVGPPPLNLIGEQGYGPIGSPTSFVARYALRDKVLYAGANDGFLHAFDAGQYRIGDDPSTPSVTESDYYDLGTGLERFGFMPGFLLSSLPKLKQYAAKPFFVDGAPVVADAWIPGSASDTVKDPDEWTTALVVGMRDGGKGYLALDVTDPDATSGAHGPYPRLLWEFADAAEPLGNTWSNAVIARLKLEGGHAGDFCGIDDGDGAAVPGGQGDCREEWVAIFGAGYSEQGDPSSANALFDPTDPAWLDDSKGIFIVSLATGQVLARASYTASDPELAEMKYAFPSEPAVLDLDFDGFADVIYIGDAGGQLWKWDLSAVGAKDGSGRVPTGVWPVGRFFTAPVASNGHRRSFFFPPAAAFVQGELVLALGTGERTDLTYMSTAGVDTNHFYVIQDPTPTGTGAFGGVPYTIADLTLLNGSATDPDTTDLGFYLESDPNEKFITDSLALGGYVITASYLPDLSASTASCTARGDAMLYIFSLADGAGFFSDPSADPDAARVMRVGSGLPASPRITTTPDGQTRIVIQTSDGGIGMGPGPKVEIKPVDLVFWQQVD